MKLRILFLMLGTLSGYAQRDINTDSLKQVLQTSISSKEKAETALKLTNYYKRIHPDSSLVYLELLKDYALKAGEKGLQGKALMAEANYLQNLTFYNKSIEINQKAINIFEELQDYDGLASGYSTLGLTYKKNSGDNKAVEAFSKRALEYSKTSLKYYELAQDTTGYLRAYSNIGIIYRDLLEYEEAEKSFRKGLEFAQKGLVETYSVGILNANLSQIYLDYYKEYDKAIPLLNEALRLYRKNNIVTSQEHAFRNLSFNYSAKGEYDKAIFYAKKAVKIALDVKDPHRQKDAFNALHVAQKGAGLFEASLKSFKASKSIRDSILSAEKAEIIAEMDAKFAVVKKDAEIAVLNSEVRVSNLEKRALILGLLALAVVAAYVYWNMQQKRHKQQLIAEQEKVITAEKLRSAEIQVESKQKELTAKVLQLAKKNEFLSSLEGEIMNLKTDVDSSVNRVTGRISKMIKRDIIGDQQWEKFSDEFSSIYGGFINNLTEKHGTFTKSELRLISLLKMNLDSKEIADTLGISTEGIKKARYRLRKKMNVEDNQLQGYLLSFS